MSDNGDLVHTVRKLRVGTRLGQLGDFIGKSTPMPADRSHRRPQRRKCPLATGYHPTWPIQYIVALTSSFNVLRESAMMLTTCGSSLGSKRSGLGVDKPTLSAGLDNR
jgi:hypothetical protein